MYGDFMINVKTSTGVSFYFWQNVNGIKNGDLDYIDKCEGGIALMQNKQQLV